MNMPEIIELKESFFDDRGFFTNIPLDIFPNGFTPTRMYFCENFQSGTVRGFHFHRKEAKVFVCLRGTVKFVLLPEELVEENSYHKYRPQVFTLTAKKPQLLYIPERWANGWQTLTDDALLLGMSNVTVKDSVNDDLRIDPHKYDEYWEVKWR